MVGSSLNESSSEHVLRCEAAYTYLGRTHVFAMRLIAVKVEVSLATFATPA